MDSVHSTDESTTLLAAHEKRELEPAQEESREAETAETSAEDAAANHALLVHGLKWALLFNVASTCVSFTGFIMSSSMSLLADAIHMTVDCGAYALNWYTEATRVDKQPTRLGFWAPVFSSAIFLCATVFVIIESVDKIKSGNTVHADRMASFAAVGLAFDVLTVVFMYKGVAANAFLHGHSHGGANGTCAHSHSHGGMADEIEEKDAGSEQQWLNIMASSLHICADLFRSVAVLTLALVFLCAHTSDATTSTWDAALAIGICTLGSLFSVYILYRAFAMGGPK